MLNLKQRRTSCIACGCDGHQSGAWSGSRWRHQMETFSVLQALCVGNSPVTGEFPSQRSVTRSFDTFFDLCLNKRLSKQWGWWFEKPSFPLWRHCNVLARLHSVESLSMVDPQWNILYWGSKWNLHTVCWGAVGCEWGTTSVYFGITYFCFIPSRLPVFAVEPEYKHRDFFIFVKSIIWRTYTKSSKKCMLV